MTGCHQAFTVSVYLTPTPSYTVVTPSFAPLVTMDDVRQCVDDRFCLLAGIEAMGEMEQEQPAIDPGGAG